MKDKRVRFIMLVVSAAFAVVAGVSSYIASDGLSVFASVSIAVLICIPATWQFFFMSAELRLKQYCLSIGLYLTFWGAPIWVYLATFYDTKFTTGIGYALLTAMLIFWGLGAFLSDRRQ